MRPFRFLLICVIIALVAAGLLLLDLWPWHPTSWRAWLLFFVIALPVTIAGEWLAEAVLNNPLSKSVDRATTGRSFSWYRIGYLLGLALLVLGPLFLGRHLLRFSQVRRRAGASGSPVWTYRKEWEALFVQHRRMVAGLIRRSRRDCSLETRTWE
jgi:hypothetical protein